MRAFKVMGWAWLLKAVFLFHFVLNYLTVIIFTIPGEGIERKSERKGGSTVRSHANCTNDIVWN